MEAMDDAGERKKRRMPTADEVVERLRDDGDFDSLRLSLIRKVKHNEELRKKIIEEVKQSVVLNQDGSEQLKLRDLSDSIYQELGTKVMGQISDEVWKLINSSEEEIKGTVDSVFERLTKPEKDKNKETSTSPPEKSRNYNNEVNEPDEPPGFNLPSNNGVKIDEIKSGEENDFAPPGFGPPKNGDDVVSGEDLDAPPGFG